MYIILMRHGEAEAESETVSNRSRRLTEKGSRNVGRTANVLRHFLKENQLRVIASPYRRTKETAEIVCETCGGGLQTAEELVQSSWGEVAAHCVTDGSPLLLVSHHPFLQSYLMTLCGAAIPFEPAAAAVIDYDIRWRQGKLVAYFAPDIRKLKKK